MKLFTIWAFCMATTEAAKRYGAIPIPSDALIPRYLVHKSFPLVRRSGNCDEGKHSCEETGNGDKCCDNDSYCYVNKAGEAKCCPIGSNCVNDSPCKSEQYYCTTTLTQSGSATTQAGCCPRRCAKTSNYLCAPDLGGACCPYDADCQKGGNCVETTKPSETSLLTPVPEGCTTRQYKCEDGAGCCDENQLCTDVSGTGYCAAGKPTQTDIKLIEEPAGLSEGAKAGIGVGAVVGASIVIGLLTWLCIHKRRERRTLMRGTSEARRTDELTDITGPTSARPQGNGLIQDYVGPDLVPGPFTETNAAQSPGQHCAVPSTPQQPGDITAPVEIDSESKMEDPMSPGSQTSFYTPMTETINGRFELDAGELHVPPNLKRSSSIMQTPVEYKTPRNDMPPRFEENRPAETKYGEDEETRP